MLLGHHLSTAQDRPAEGWEYFGQEPPGAAPTVFAPGIISGKGRIHCFPAISPDGREVLWMTLPPRLHISRYQGTAWTEAQEPDLFSGIMALRPCYSADGSRIYFAANLPGGQGSLDIWFIEVSPSGYGEPFNLGPPVNTSGFEAQQSFTDQGTVYYNGPVPGKRWGRGILRSRFTRGSFSDPEVIGSPINIIDTLAIDYTPFIAGDETFLLFSSNRHDPAGEQCRVFISFRDEGDRWSEPVNLSEWIGFDGDSRDPAVSPDGKYLFFSSGMNIYWLDARVIPEIRESGI